MFHWVPFSNYVAGMDYGSAPSLARPLRQARHCKHGVVLQFFFLSLGIFFGSALGLLGAGVLGLGFFFGSMRASPVSAIATDGGGWPAVGGGGGVGSTHGWKDCETSVRGIHPQRGGALRPQGHAATQMPPAGTGQSTNHWGICRLFWFSEADVMVRGPPHKKGNTMSTCMHVMMSANPKVIPKPQSYPELAFVSEPVFFIFKFPVKDFQFVFVFAAYFWEICW